MEDRELIELAAKAAGIRGQFLGDEFWLDGDRTPDNDKTWNPLGRDGDAFRSAVKCEIAFGKHANTHWARWEYGDKVFRENAEKGGIQDPLAAARRAIVRALAEIGRSMP